MGVYLSFIGFSLSFFIGFSSQLAAVQAFGDSTGGSLAGIGRLILFYGYRKFMCIHYIYNKEKNHPSQRLISRKTSSSSFDRIANTLNDQRLEAMNARAHDFLYFLFPT